MEAPNGNTSKGQLRYAPSFTQGNVPSGSLPERLRHIPIPLRLWVSSLVKNRSAGVDRDSLSTGVPAVAYMASAKRIRLRLWGKFLGISATSVGKKGSGRRTGARVLFCINFGQVPWYQVRLTRYTVPFAVRADQGRQTQGRRQGGSWASP